jgi:hypothetical protein
MHNPVTVEVRQTAFEKDIEMVQGNEKTGQKGTNSMFVMNLSKVRKAYTEKQKFTYAKIVVDYSPQKEDPHRICITAGGNLTQYKGDVSVCTLDLTTSKLLWNSILNTRDAKYMSLDIKKIISPPHWNISNTCKCCLSFPIGSNNNTNLTRIVIGHGIGRILIPAKWRGLLKASCWSKR